MPNDGIQIVKADLSTNDADVGMKRKNEMPAENTSGHAYIANHTHKASTGNEEAENVLPNFFQFSQKCFIILDMPQLIGILVVPFEVPVGRGSNNEVNGLVLQEGKSRASPWISL